MATSARTLRIAWAGMLGLSGTFCYLIFSIFYNNLPLENGFVMKNGMLLGGDFITFYVAGKMYSTDPSHLYDLLRQKEVRTLLLGPSSIALKGELPFVYPPLVAVLFSCLAPFSFSDAYIYWTVIALCVSFFSLFAVLLHIGRKNILFVISAFIVFAGYFPFSMNSILGGQLSWVGFSLVCWIFLALERNRPYMAGMLMSLSYYKPPLFLLALIVFICTQGRDFFWGFLTGAFLLISLTLVAVDISGFTHYLRLVSRYTYGQKLFEDVELPPGEGAGIFALITTFAPDMQTTLVLFGAIFLVTVFILIWYSHEIAVRYWDVWYSTVWIASVGLSLQCIRYDLALVFLPLFLIFLALERLSISWSVLLGSALFGFYLEWLSRGKEYLGVVLNLSSFLFVYILMVLLSLTIGMKRRGFHVKG